MTKITFKKWIAMQGLHPVKIWENPKGIYARVKGYTTKGDGFSQILSGGTVVTLSHTDVINPLVVGEGIEVVL